LGVEAGKHILTEEPCAASSAEFRTVVQAAHKQDVRLGGGNGSERLCCWLREKLSDVPEEQVARVS
jgi:hypothetical protein